MFVARRVMYRMRVRTEDWMHENAFLLGLLFGGTATLLILLVH